MSRLLVSLPTIPPSASLSLDVELTEGAGEAIRLGIGDGTALEFPLMYSLKEGFSCPPEDLVAFNFLAASVRVCLFPVPNLFQGWPGRVRCLFS